MRWGASLLVFAFVLLPATVWPATSAAFYNLHTGDPVPNTELQQLGGGKGRLTQPGADANVFVFFKADQDNSQLVLKELAKCKTELDGKKLYLVGVHGVGGEDFKKSTVRSALAEAGLEMPVLLDPENRLYGRIGAVLTPALGIADKDGVLRSYQPFVKLNYCAVVKARVLHMLGELDDAGLDKAINPKAAKLGGDVAVAKRNIKLATMLYKAKKYDKALGMVEKTVELAPEYAPGHGLMAAILAGKGECDKAKLSIEKAVAIDAGDAMAAEAKKACGTK